MGKKAYVSINSDRKGGKLCPDLGHAVTYLLGKAAGFEKIKQSWATTAAGGPKRLRSKNIQGGGSCSEGEALRLGLFHRAVDSGRGHKTRQDL